MIKSKAAAPDTYNFAKRHPKLMRKTLGKAGLTVSSCGFGSYRVDYRVREHFEAMEYAIANGINLIDTSANYSDGGSEILIGNVLLDLINQGKIKREEIVIVTKGGYLQGKNLEAAKQMKESGKGYKEITEYTDNLWHSIHPDFLKDQITFSLERMKLESADIYLLHNPEYFLDSPMAKELEPEELIHEYYNRIKKAFEYLETEVQNGRISCYGISSNAFVKPSDELVFTSLEKCLNLANDISLDNHFYVIQLPLNLFERGAIVNKNQLGDTLSLIELAGKHKIGILINRPLNALNEKGLNRLSDFEIDEEFTKLEEAHIIAEINLLDSMEEDFLRNYIEVLNLSEQNKQAINYFLKAGQLLKENWKNFGSIEGFNDIKKQFLIPRVNYALTTLVSSANLTDEMKDRIDKIAKQVNKLMKIMDSIYGLMANVRSKELHLKLNTLVKQSEGDKFMNLSLSQKALLMINSINVISCTLVGMRQKKYVDDVIGCLKEPKIPKAIGKWKNLDFS